MAQALHQLDADEPASDDHRPLRRPGEPFAAVEMLHRHKVYDAVLDAFHAWPGDRVWPRAHCEHELVVWQQLPALQLDAFLHRIDVDNPIADAFDLLRVVAGAL